MLTQGEIRNGVSRLRLGQRRARLESWLRVDLPSRFQDRILPIDAAIADRWGRISAVAALKGKPVPVIDGLLAATAIHHNLTLVTRNSSDVSGSSVATLNPWLYRHLPTPHAFPRAANMLGTPQKHRRQDRRRYGYGGIEFFVAPAVLPPVLCGPRSTASAPPILRALRDGKSMRQQP